MIHISTFSLFKRQGLGRPFFISSLPENTYDRTKVLLPEIGYGSNIKFFYGDGYKGLPSFAPYDRAIVTAGAPYIPEPLLQQLKVGGRLVIPVGAGDVQVMTLIVKTGENQYRKEEFGHFRFVPLLGEREW